MYFKRSLYKIIKVRTSLGQMKFCRHSHTSYLRQFVLSKCDESRNTKSPLPLSTFSRSFGIVNSKENGSKSAKSRSRLDLMAPNFRSNYSSLKSTSENGNETGMRQKSLTLKMCRQTSKKLSTFRANNGNDPSEEKPAKMEETMTKNETDFCRQICARSSLNFTSETNTLKPSFDRKVSKRAIEDLTDAEIAEICKTRCPCKQSHVSGAKLTENVKGSLPTIHTANSSKNPSTTIQSTARLQDSSERKLAGSSESFGTIISSTNIKKIRRNRSAERKAKYMSGDQRHTPLSRYTNNLSHSSNHVNSSRQTNRIEPIHAPSNLSRPKDNFRQNSSVGTMHPMQSLPFTSSKKLKSHYARMTRSIQSSRLPFRYRPTQVQEMLPTSQIDPRQIYRIDLRQGFHAPHSLPRPQDSIRRITSFESFQTQVKPNSNRCADFTTNICHFEQLQPVPSTYLPIYPNNHYSDPVVENRSPRSVEVPYLSLNLSQRYQQNRQINTPAIGSQSNRNRQTLCIQSNMPTKFVTASMNINNVTVDDTKEVALPMLEIEKTKLVNSVVGNLETMQQSRKIMSKVVENLAVVIDGPARLKLVTSLCPKLRDEKDVIIRMEYVNLTDADARHFLTGKYNAYSYATTTVGRTGSGTIIEAGQNVDNVKPGDKVFVKPISCGKCSLCLSDHRNLCEYVTASELSQTTGVLSRLHVHSSEFVTKIPDNVSILNGAMTWTLSTAIRGCQKASVSAGDVVMVIGGGALGMATSLAAQLLGATTVCLADIRKPVLDYAEKLGIEKVFLIDPKSPSKNIAIKLWEEIGSYPRVTFDCSGARLTNEIAINATQTGGKVVVMTNSDADIPLPISNLVARDIDVIISTCGNDESDIAALRFLSTKKISFGNSLCKHYDLSNVQEAFDDLQSPNRLDSQIIVKCGCACGKGNL